MFHQLMFHVIHQLFQSIFFLNLDSWFSVLFSKVVIFWYSIFKLLYQSYVINNVLSILWRYISFFRYCSIKSDIYCCNYWTISELFYAKVLETFVILSAILLPVKSTVASVAVWIAFLRQFYVHQLLTVWHDQNVFGCIYCLRFYQCFW